MHTAIEYVGTHHKCRCLQCGQIFFVDMGNIYDLPPKPQAHDIKVKCPVCGLIRRTKHHLFDLRRLQRRPASKKVFRTYTSAGDCTCGQVSAGVMQRDLAAMTSMCITMRMHCQKILDKWKSDWSCSVMPVEMNELQRVLRELEHPLE